MVQYDERLISVMAPLLISSDEQFAEFERHLAQASAIGVEAVSVDVWWGLVQEAEDVFRWDYYDRVFSAIRRQGLGIVPIMSYHRCGGGPGDDVNIPLPRWLQEFIKNRNGSPSELEYESETGYRSNDSIPPWLGEETPAIYEPMIRLLESFLERYRTQLMGGVFPEINISLGPTGELRYPAYSQADGWKYPHRGYYQCYSESARRSFLRWVRAPENGCTWADHFADTDIRVPNGHLPGGHGARADAFVAERLHLQPGYGKDFVNWYHRSLIAHGKRLLTAALQTLEHHCSADVETAPLIGLKIPGVHWQWRCTGVPRYAELTAGLIAPDCCFVPTAESKTGYESLFEMVRQLRESHSWPLRVHFTALELDDDSVPESWPNDAEKTSMAHSLVRAVGRTAASFNILLSGENALSDVDAPDSPTNVASWDYVRRSFDSGYFSGLTLLRLCRGGWDTDQNALKAFIRDYDRDGRDVWPRVARKLVSVLPPAPDSD